MGWITEPRESHSKSNIVYFGELTCLALCLIYFIPFCLGWNKKVTDLGLKSTSLKEWRIEIWNKYRWNSLLVWRLQNILRYKILYFLVRFERELELFNRPLLLTCPPPFLLLLLRLLFVKISQLILVLETWNFHQTQTRPRLDQNQKKIFGSTWTCTGTVWFDLKPNLNLYLC